VIFFTLPALNVIRINPLEFSYSKWCEKKKVKTRRKSFKIPVSLVVSTQSASVTDEQNC